MYYSWYIFLTFHIFKYIFIGSIILFCRAEQEKRKMIEKERNTKTGSRARSLHLLRVAPPPPPPPPRRRSRWEPLMFLQAVDVWLFLYEEHDAFFYASLSYARSSTGQPSKNKKIRKPRSITAPAPRGSTTRSSSGSLGSEDLSSRSNRFSVF